MKVVTPVAERVISAGAVIVGCVSSITVTSCVAIAVFPPLSVAVHVIVVVPTPNTFPLGRRVTMTPGRSSVAVAVPSTAFVTTVSQVVALEPVLAVTFAGPVIVGG
jgi:hypothetical protein